MRPDQAPHAGLPCICVCHVRDRDCSICGVARLCGGPNVLPRIEGGTPSLLGGGSRLYGSIGVFEKKFYRNFGDFRNLADMLHHEARATNVDVE